MENRSLAKLYFRHEIYEYAIFILQLHETLWSNWRDKAMAKLVSVAYSFGLDMNVLFLMSVFRSVHDEDVPKDVEQN